MNCSPTISTALLLLSLTAGMFLLYKTQKENLGTFFKIVSWFIIIASVSSMICCAVCCLICDRQCKMESNHQECGPEGVNKRVMIYSDADRELEEKGCCKGMEECEEDKAGCEEGEEKCCQKESMGCEKRIIEKDTVIHRK